MERRNFVGRSAKNAKQKNASVLHSIHIPGAKHYKIKRDGQVYIFSGITPKQFKELSNAKVVGRFSGKIDRKRVSTSDTRQFEIQKGQSGSKVTFDIYNTTRRLCRAAAYVPIGNDEYLVYEKFALAKVTVPSAVAALAVVAGLLALAKNPTNPLGIAPTVAIGGDGKEPTSEIETIDFAGYDDVTVTASDPYVLLQNPESNDVYFSYVLSDSSGDEFMTTDLIPPGKALQWNPRNDLGSGTHTISMHIDTYDMEDTAIPYNAMNYDSVKVTVQ